MIVIGVDVQKHSLTAVAVDEMGRLLAERTLQGAEDGLVGALVEEARATPGCWANCSGVSHGAAQTQSQRAFSPARATPAELAELAAAEGAKA